MSGPNHLGFWPHQLTCDTAVCDRHGVSSSYVVRGYSAVLCDAGLVSAALDRTTTAMPAHSALLAVRRPRNPPPAAIECDSAALPATSVLWRGVVRRGGGEEAAGAPCPRRGGGMAAGGGAESAGAGTQAAEVVGHSALQVDRVFKAEAQRCAPLHAANTDYRPHRWP